MFGNRKTSIGARQSNLNLMEEIEKKEFLYVWIDILGFKNELLKEDEGVYNRLFEIKNNFKEHFSEPTLKAIVSISDGLVLVWSIDNDLKEIFQQLAKLQLNFILENNYVIRGAISVGTISEKLYRQYVSKDSDNEKYEIEKVENKNNDIFLISNGLVKAYEMESKEIKWPIIATDLETIERLRSIKRINNENEFFGLQKINGNNKMYLYMIDFLEHLEDKQMEYENFLLKKLNENQNNRKIFEKYYWLLEYYKNRMGSNVFEKFREFYDGVLI